MGEWRMANGEWRMGEWRMANGRMANGEWRMGEWRMANGEWETRPPAPALQMPSSKAAPRY
ncbi:MAG: hypothetical protein B6243_02635 [Anaerolineaceae bacterium 4572_5.2]|nr:MAG: hypothetical protein B6243_02635 [Anaerolineaceae bacterium 4572_5.2]